MQDLTETCTQGFFTEILAGIIDFLEKNPQELPKYQTIMQGIIDNNAQDQAWLSTKLGKLCALLCVRLFPTLTAPQRAIEVGNQELQRIALQKEWLDKNLVQDNTNLIVREFLPLDLIEEDQQNS